MNKKRSLITLFVAALAVGPAYAAGRRNSTDMEQSQKTNSISQSQRSESQTGWQGNPNEQKINPNEQQSGARTQTKGVIESVSAPTNEVVVVDDVGGRHQETLSQTAVIKNGDTAMSINDLKPGDQVNITQNSNGDVIEVALLPQEGQTLPSKKKG
jgi:hypothetical protein